MYKIYISYFVELSSGGKRFFTEMKIKILTVESTTETSLQHNNSPNTQNLTP